MLRCCVLCMACALSNFAQIENDLPVDRAIKRAKGATSTSIGRSRFAEPETIRLTKLPGLIPSRLRQRRRRVTRSGTSSSSAALDPAPHVLKRTKRSGDKKSCVAVVPKASFGKSASHFRSTPISGPFHGPPALRISAKNGSDCFRWLDVRQSFCHSFGKSCLAQTVNKYLELR
jgi:hypothetical protein